MRRFIQKNPEIAAGLQFGATFAVWVSTPSHTQTETMNRNRKEDIQRVVDRSYTNATRITKIERWKGDKQ